MTHLQASALIFIVNLILMGLGLWTLRWCLPPLVGLALGIALVATLLIRFYYIGFKHGHVSTPRGQMSPWQLRINKAMAKIFHP